MNTGAKWWEITSAKLHILAMGLMLLDHMWATLFPSQAWMTCVGRIAYPIFAFLIVEGYFHTKDFKKYLLRMVLFAVVSEIPFNLMYNGTFFYPYHQNVLWTFVIGLLAMKCMDWSKTKAKWCFVLISIVTVLVGTLLGFALFTDYYGVGVLMILTFYLFRGRKWWQLLGQFCLLYWLNVEVLGGYYYEVELFGKTFEVIQQGLALFALIPIWLYRGKQGYHSKPFQYFCYSFYPLHMLLLVLIGMVMVGL